VEKAKRERCSARKKITSIVADEQHHSAAQNFWCPEVH
jgi:hypothetical protein